MTTNKILLAGLVGAVVAFFLGWLVWGVLMGEFFQSNAGSASGVMRGDDEMMWGALAVGHLAMGMLYAIIFGRWANISTFATGAKAGAVIGGLMALTYDMINLGTTHIMTPTGAITDVILSAIVAAITGGVIGWFLGRDAAK